jgi:acyl-CoA synthetase (AMP-forming)/AMP-acid ligase II
MVRGMHYCLRKIDCTEIWKLLKEENITHFNASPIVNKLLCGHPLAEALPEPVHVTVAGSSPTPHLFEMMTRLNLRPVHVYGLTETYGPITKGYPIPAWDNIPPKEKYQRMVRQGHGSVTSLPIRVIKTGLPDGKIVNVKQDGKEVGEVVFEGNMCAKGYYKNPEATKELFARGVLHSGDGAVLYEDGSFRVLGRQEDIIITGNYLIAFYSSYYYKCRSRPADTDSNTNRRGKVLVPHP